MMYRIHHDPARPWRGGAGRRHRRRLRQRRQRQRSHASPPAACDVYATIGAAMFGDPSGVPDAAATLTAEAPDEPATTRRSPTATAFDRRVSTATRRPWSPPSSPPPPRNSARLRTRRARPSRSSTCSGIDYGFEGLPERGRRRPLAIRFTNDTTTDEQHELVLMQKADGVTETAAELLELPEEELMTQGRAGRRRVRRRQGRRERLARRPRARRRTSRSA